MARRCGEHDLVHLGRRCREQNAERAARAYAVVVVAHGAVRSPELRMSLELERGCGDEVSRQLVRFARRFARCDVKAARASWSSGGIVRAIRVTARAPHDRARAEWSRSRARPSGALP